MKNDYEIRGEVTAIFLKRKDGTTLETIISTSRLDKVQSYVGTWYPSYNKATRSFYARGHINGGTRKDRGKSMGLHRFILDPLIDMVIDHQNHDTLDNTDENLKNCTHKENSANLSPRRFDYEKGIRWRKDRGKWRVEHNLFGKYYHLGHFKEYEDAVKANETFFKTHNLVSI